MKNPEPEENIITLCKECRKRLYPNAGNWKKPDMKFASHVKKNFNGEHMWVKIVSIHDDGVIGTVDNIPVTEGSPTLGTMVCVPYEEIEDVM